MLMGKTNQQFEDALEKWLQEWIDETPLEDREGLVQAASACLKDLAFEKMEKLVLLKQNELK